jgi:hypothetical protein
LASAASNHARSCATEESRRSPQTHLATSASGA